MTERIERIEKWFYDAPVAFQDNVEMTLMNDSDVIYLFEQLRVFEKRVNVLRESLLRSRGAGYNEDCIFCGMKDHITDEALAKVRGDE